LLAWGTGLETELITFLKHLASTTTDPVTYKQIQTVLRDYPDGTQDCELLPEMQEPGL
jgi:hypothetical protein